MSGRTAAVSRLVRWLAPIVAAITAMFAPSMAVGTSYDHHAAIPLPSIVGASESVSAGYSAERPASAESGARATSLRSGRDLSAPQTTRPAGPGPRGGDSPAAARGRQAHADASYGPGFQNEFTLPSGRRVDGINFDTRTVVELKPNNPRAIRSGERQLSDYIDELNAEFPGSTPWTGWVETYDP